MEQRQACAVLSVLRLCFPLLTTPATGALPALASSASQISLFSSKQLWLQVHCQLSFSLRGASLFSIAKNFQLSLSVARLYFR